MKDIIQRSLQEDIGRGDITTKSLVPKGTMAKAKIIAKEDGIVAGIAFAKEVYRHVDPSLKFMSFCKESCKVKKGYVIATVSGSAASIITGERVVLNFLQSMSGIATYTSKFVEKIKGTKAVILDTRKTMPGTRIMSKIAVENGGGSNHRMGLYDAILIKDNHIAIVGDIKKAVEKTKKFGFVEVEAKSLDQVKQSLEAGADRILLDNMNIPMMKKAVKAIRSWRKKKVQIEASGGVNLKTVRNIAKTGVDFISVGALTHSADALDISLDIVEIII